MGQCGCPRPPPRTHTAVQSKGCFKGSHHHRNQVSIISSLISTQEPLETFPLTLPPLVFQEAAVSGGVSPRSLLNKAHRK